MGTDSSLKKKYNQENNVKLNICLDKVCFSPGEFITGHLDIQPKAGLVEAILNDSSAIFKLTQFQQYHYIEGDIAKYVDEISDILNMNIDFSNFIGANILLGINIPFSFQIPLNILPTIFFGDYYIKHFISFTMPGINAMRTLIIIIKGYKIFNFENKLLKMPASGFGDFYMKPKGDYKGGKVSCLLNIPKNSFSYFEIIPFEILINCTELNMEIKALKISIMKYIYFNDKKDHKKHFNAYEEEELVSKIYTLKKNLNKYDIKDDIKLPRDLNEFKEFKELENGEIYSTFDNLKMLEVDYNFSKIKLTPFSIGGLISIEFKLKVEIEYNKNRTKNSFELPIEFLDKNSKNQIIYIPNLNKNSKQNEKNKCYNINSIDENDNNNNSEENHDFVVIEHEDFQQAFFGDKNK